MYEGHVFLPKSKLYAEFLNDVNFAVFGAIKRQSRGHLLDVCDASSFTRSRGFTPPLLGPDRQRAILSRRLREREDIPTKGKTAGGNGPRQPQCLSNKAKYRLRESKGAPRLPRTPRSSGSGYSI